MGRDTFPIQPLHVRLEGLNGIGRISFLATFKHGKGTRDLRVTVQPEAILALADALRATADGACDGKNHRHVRGPDERYAVGHAVWHFQHPEAPMPCIDHSTVIDVVDAPSLPEGSE